MRRNPAAQALACSYGSVRHVAVGFSLRLIGVPQTSDREMSAGLVFAAPQHCSAPGLRGDSARSRQVVGEAPARQGSSGSAPRCFPHGRGRVGAFWGSFSSAEAEQERSEVVSARQGPNGSVPGWLLLGSGRAGAMPPVILCFWSGSL